MPTNHTKCVCCEETHGIDMFSKRQLNKTDPKCMNCTNRKHNKEKCLEQKKVREEKEEAERTRQAHLASEKKEKIDKFENNKEDALAYLKDMARQLNVGNLKREKAVHEFGTYFPKEVEYTDPILSEIIGIIRSNIEKKTILCRGCGPGCGGHFSGTRMFQGVTFPKSPVEMERTRKDVLTKKGLCNKCNKSSPYLTTVMEGSFCPNCYCRHCRGPKEGPELQFFCPKCGNF